MRSIESWERERLTEREREREGGERGGERERTWTLNFIFQGL